MNDLDPPSRTLSLESPSSTANARTEAFCLQVTPLGYPRLCFKVLVIHSLAPALPCEFYSRGGSTARLKLSMHSNLARVQALKSLAGPRSEGAEGYNIPIFFFF